MNYQLKKLETTRNIKATRLKYLKEKPAIRVAEPDIVVDIGSGEEDIGDGEEDIGGGEEDIGGGEEDIGGGEEDIGGLPVGDK